MSNEGFVSKIYKDLLKLNSSKTSNPIKKWAKCKNRHLKKEVIYMSNKHMKRSSSSFVIRELQNKTTVKCHYTPIRIAKIMA